MVPDDEIPTIRHLVGQVNITVTQRLFFQIRLIQFHLVNEYGSVFCYIHPVAWTGNVPFDEKLVPIPESNDVSGLKTASFYRYYDLSLLERRRHRITEYSKHRQSQCCRQNCKRRNHDEGKYGASQYPLISCFVFLVLQFVLQFRKRRACKIISHFRCVLPSVV